MPGLGTRLTVSASCGSVPEGAGASAAHILRALDNGEGAVHGAAQAQETLNAESVVPEVERVGLEVPEARHGDSLGVAPAGEEPSEVWAVCDLVGVDENHS